MNNILITGGAGFIGANFVSYMRDKYPSVNLVILDALTYAGNRHSIDHFEDTNGFSFLQGDICDEVLVSKILNNHNIDSIIHFAAESHVDRSILGPDTFIKTNIIGTYTLLKSAKEYWLDNGNHKKTHHFHHVSTDEVFGSLNSDSPAFHEMSAYDPSSPYSASKASSDHLVRAWHHTYNMSITISNCSNNYGPFHYPEKLIPLTIINILHGQPIPVYGEGRNVRDWLYVTDHCRGIDVILNKGTSGETYNIGGESEFSNIEVVQKVCIALNKILNNNEAISAAFPACPASRNGDCRDLIKFVKDRPGHDFRYAMDISKIRKELDYSPAETFDAGIVKTITWYLENETWWRPLLDDKYHAWLSCQYNQA